MNREKIKDKVFDKFPTVSSFDIIEHPHGVIEVSVWGMPYSKADDGCNREYLGNLKLCKDEVT